MRQAFDLEDEFEIVKHSRTELLISMLTLFQRFTASFGSSWFLESDTIVFQLSKKMSHVVGNLNDLLGYAKKLRKC